MSKDITKYKVKHDLIFKYIFSHKDILKSFLQAILGNKIDKVEVKSSFSLDISNVLEKQGVLDIKATIDDEKVVDLEMQNKIHSGYVKRIFLYFGGLIREQINSGEDYQDIKDVIIINILNETMFKDIEKVHTVWRLREDRHPEYGALNGMQIHFIELDKFRKQKNPNFNNELNQWLAFVDTENKEWVESVMEKNKEIELASELKEEFESDRIKREMYEAYEKLKLDIKAHMRDVENFAKQKGMKRGMKKGIAEGIEKGMAKGIEKGMAEGIEKGMAEGIEKGIAQGIKVEKENVAKAMLKENISIELISKTTGLNINLIEKLK